MGDEPTNQPLSLLDRDLDAPRPPFASPPLEAPPPPPFVPDGPKTRGLEGEFVAPFAPQGPEGESSVGRSRGKFDALPAGESARGAAVGKGIDGPVGEPSRGIAVGKVAVHNCSPPTQEIGHCEAAPRATDDRTK